MYHKITRSRANPKTDDKSPVTIEMVFNADPIIDDIIMTILLHFLPENNASAIVNESTARIPEINNIPKPNKAAEA